MVRTDVDHLPASKQRERERVKAIIFEEFGDAVALATMGWKKKGRIDKIILYGSYARGGWVDEPHTAKGSRSDFELLIIVTDTIGRASCRDRVCQYVTISVVAV